MTDAASYPLAAADRDLDRGPAAAPPDRSYVVCATPRSGSTLLCEALASTGRLGMPLEYFDRTAAHAELRRRWGCRDLECFIRCLHRRRVDPGGVLGVKIHWFQLLEVTEELHAGSGAVEERASRILERIAPGAALVRIRRLDRDRQAVSWARALRTGRWSRRVGEETPLEEPVPLELVSDCRRRIDEDDTAWERFFAWRGVEPVRVTYEQLVRDFEGTARRVAAGLGAPDARIAPPDLVCQADGRSDELLSRLRQPGSGRSAPRS